MGVRRCKNGFWKSRNSAWDSFLIGEFDGLQSKSVSIVRRMKLAGATRPCNSIFGENYRLYKLVAKKLDFVLSKLQSEKIEPLWHGK